MAKGGFLTIPSLKSLDFTDGVYELSSLDH